MDRPLQVLGSPVRVQGTAAGPAIPPPLLGEHTDTLLGELGYSTDDIAALRGLVPLGLEGAIVGKALYAGAFTLPEALSAVAE